MSAKVRVVVKGESKLFRLESSDTLDTLKQHVRERFDLASSIALNLHYIDVDDNSKQAINKQADFVYFVKEAAAAAPTILEVIAETGSASSSPSSASSSSTPSFSSSSSSSSTPLAPPLSTNTPVSSSSTSSTRSATSPSSVTSTSTFRPPVTTLPSSSTATINASTLSSAPFPTASSSSSSTSSSAAPLRPAPTAPISFAAARSKFGATPPSSSSSSSTPSSVSGKPADNTAINSLAAKRASANYPEPSRAPFTKPISFNNPSSSSSHAATSPSNIATSQPSSTSSSAPSLSATITTAPPRSVASPAGAASSSSRSANGNGNHNTMTATVASNVSPQLVQEFNRAVAANDVDRVVQVSTQLLQSDPENIVVLYNRAAAFAGKDRHGDAIPDYSLVIQLQRDHLAALCGRGNSYLAIGVIDKGLEDLQTAIHYDREYAAAYHGLSVAYARTERYEEAVAAETQAIERAEREAASPSALVAIFGVTLEEMYYNRGWSYSRLGNGDAAVSDFSKALQSQPRLVKALNSRSKVYAQQNKWPAALADYQRLVQVGDDKAHYYHMQAVAHHSLGDFAEAIGADTQSLSLQPSFAAYYNRALSHARIDQIEPAIADNTRAIDWARGGHEYVEPQQLAHAYCNRGCLYSALGNWEAAIADWTASIEIYPTSTALNLRALAYYQNGNIAAALKDWDASIALDPTSTALLQRGNHFLAAGQPDAALSDYNRAIDLINQEKERNAAAGINNDENDKAAGEAYANRAAALLMLGDYEGALKDADRALLVNPNSAPLHHVKALAERGLGKYDQAVIDHNKALLLDPSNPVYQRALEEGKQLQKSHPARPSLVDIRGVMGGGGPGGALINGEGGSGGSSSSKAGAPKAYAPLTVAESQQLMKDEGLTDEEMEFLASEYGGLLEQLRKSGGGRLMLTPEMKRRVAEYRERLKKFPVLKRWKPALAACLIIDTYAAPKFKPKKALGPLLK